MLQRVHDQLVELCEICCRDKMVQECDVKQCERFYNTLKGQCHENHFKNSRVHKLIYSNEKPTRGGPFSSKWQCQCNEDGKKKRLYHYANNRNLSSELEKFDSSGTFQVLPFCHENSSLKKYSSTFL